MLAIFFCSLQDVEDVFESQFKDVIYGISSGDATQKNDIIRANDSLTASLDEKRQTLLSMISFFCVNRSILSEF